MECKQTDEQWGQAWQARYTRLAIEADGRWNAEDFALLARLCAERDAERRARSAAAAFKRIITRAEEET